MKIQDEEEGTQPSLTIRNMALKTRADVCKRPIQVCGWREERALQMLRPASWAVPLSGEWAAKCAFRWQERAVTSNSCRCPDLRGQGSGSGAGV